MVKFKDFTKLLTLLICLFFCISTSAYGTGSTFSYTLRTDVQWTGLYSNLTTSYSHPYQYFYKGYNFQLDTDSLSLGINETCIGSEHIDIELYPPFTVTDRFISSRFYTSTHPISNDLAVCSIDYDGSNISRDDDFYSTDKYSDKMTFTFGSTLLEDPIPGSLWDFRIGGVLIGKFDPVAVPPRTTEGKIDGIVPSIKLIRNAMGKITSVSVKWYKENSTVAGGYEEVSAAVAATVVKAFSIYFENNSGSSTRYENIDFPSVIVTSVTPVNDWYYGNYGISSEQAEKVGICWKDDNVGNFVHFPKYVNPVNASLSLIMPVPSSDQSYITSATRFYNGTSDGINFGFTKSGSLPESREVVAPCKGVITKIEQVVMSSGNCVVKVNLLFNNQRKIYFCFEPEESSDPNSRVNKSQLKQIKVYEGQVVNQGDTIGNLLVTNANAHLYWSLYEIDPVSGAKTAVCPRDTFTTAAVTQIDALYTRLPIGLPVCQ